MAGAQPSPIKTVACQNISVAIRGQKNSPECMQRIRTVTKYWMQSKFLAAIQVDTQPANEAPKNSKGEQLRACLTGYL